MNALAAKKQRILETFFDGLIDRAERDRRIGQIEAETVTYQQLSLEEADEEGSKAIEDLNTVLEAIEPFAEWEFLEREDKRALLSDLCPDISVYRYSVKSVTLKLGQRQARGSYEVSHSKTVP